MATPGRERCLSALVEHLAGTRLGQDLGLARIGSLEDLRAAIPVMDRDEHEREVEARLGFGVLDEDDPRAGELERGSVEREHVVSVWHAWLGEPPRRVALLRGRGPDPAMDRIAAGDVAALQAAMLHIDRAEAPEEVLERLRAHDPDVLVVPSVRIAEWLESVQRRPLERVLPRLRLVLAEHDHDTHLRSHRPVRSSGWILRCGRVGLPTKRPPDGAITLALASTIIELLPYTNPEEDARRVYAKQTLLPEQALVGQRYELVVSSPLGFLRLRTDEHVRVVGFDAPSDDAPFPRPRVVRLPPAPPDIALEGCTVAGAWLTAAIRQALQREDPALVGAEIGPDPRSVPKGAAAMQTGSMALPDAFKETELAWLAKTGAHKVERKRPRGLLLKIELQGYVARELPDMLAKRIDASLRERSPAYAYLRERDELRPPRVIVLPGGTRRSEEQRRIREMLGAVAVPDVRVVGL